jgi:peptidoglycan lytic transglycosylase
MVRARRVREPRWSRAAFGALMIGIPASVGVVTAGQALAQTVSGNSDSGGTLATHMKSHRLAYGESVVLDGNAPASSGTHQLQLQFAASGAGGAWSTVSSSTVASGARFHLSAPLKRSGVVRVVDRGSGGATPTASAASSSTQWVTVAARLRLRPQAINDLGGGPVDVRGRLLPGLPGRKVRLQGLSGSGWHTVAVARTSQGGLFDLRYRPTGAQQLRVRFAGDRANTWTGGPAGRVIVFRQTVASWYNDGGSTACGFHAYYGVANRDLPCGTQVSFWAGGRTVTATVDDRGPYVGGRDWDLNQNTAGALGFGGVGSVWSSL